MTAKQVIEHEYGDSKNFMTPNVLEIGWIIPGQLAYELSEGTGFNYEPIFGVSVVRVVGNETKREFNLSKCYHSYDSARTAIEELTEKEKNDVSLEH